MDKPHKKLKAWQLGMEIVSDIYQLTESFPAEEKHGITSQIRRSVVSIPSNIAEGAARNTNKEFVNFLHIAQGSLSELDTQLEISLRLNLINQEILQSLNSKLIEEDKILTGLILSLKDKK